MGAALSARNCSLNAPNRPRGLSLQRLPAGRFPRRRAAPGLGVCGARLGSWRVGPGRRNLLPCRTRASTVHLYLLAGPQKNDPSSLLSHPLPTRRVHSEAKLGTISEAECGARGTNRSDVRPCASFISRISLYLLNLYCFNV